MDREAIRPIVNGIVNVRKVLEKDVFQMYEVLEIVIHDFYANLNTHPSLANHRKQFDDCFSAIFWSLKLHLEFHCVPVSSDGQEVLKKLGEFLKLKELNRSLDQEYAVDPVSKVVEIVNLLIHASEAPDGHNKTEDIFKIVQTFLDALDSDNIFRPIVLAKVMRNDRGFVGSSIRVSPFLRPLCLLKRIINFKLRLRKAVVLVETLPSPSDDQATESSWSSTAYGHVIIPVEERGASENRVRYIKEKAPCKKCQKTFKELMGFIRGPNLESAGDNTFLGACAEYCPVNELIPDDDVGRDAELEMRDKLDGHREQCSVFTEGIRKVCQYANKLDAKFERNVKIKPDDKYRDELLEYAVNELKVNQIHIFGFEPECIM